MDRLKDVLRVNKRTLILVAGMVWAFAGFRVFSLGSEDVINNKASIILILGIGGLAYYLFYNFIFSKMSVKHITRIVNHELEQRCIFAFFDKKSYIIMACMMIGGIGLRSLGIINPIYLGSFYIGLGGALFTAGVFFLINWVNFDKTKLKYSLDN
ncbi:MAG: hypothetical protein ACRCXA_14725 [Peptostreptococcaceae bacterium]